MTPTRNRSEPGVLQASEKRKQRKREARRLKRIKQRREAVSERKDKVKRETLTTRRLVILQVENGMAERSQPSQDMVNMGVTDQMAIDEKKGQASRSAKNNSEAERKRSGEMWRFAQEYFWRYEELCESQKRAKRLAAGNKTKRRELNERMEAVKEIREKMTTMMERVETMEASCRKERLALRREKKIRGEQWSEKEKSMDEIRKHMKKSKEMQERLSKRMAEDASYLIEMHKRLSGAPAPDTLLQIQSKKDGKGG